MSGFDINQLTISGNLTRDPELRNLPSNQNVCSIRIAHNERFKDAAGEWADRAAYFDVTIWSGLGEWIAKNVSKGDKVVVAGRLRWREWETDGTKHQAVDITADSIVPVPRSGDPAASTQGFSSLRCARRSCHARWHRQLRWCLGAGPAARPGGRAAWVAYAAAGSGSATALA